MKYPVRYVYSRFIDARAGRGGIEITTALIAAVSPALVPAVIAHEEGHLELRHIEKRAVLMALMLAVGLAAAIFWALGAPAPLIAVPLAVCWLWQPLRNLQGRFHEHQADAYAAKLGFGAQLADALVLMERNMQAQGAMVGASHPSNASRIIKLLAAHEKWRARQSSGT